MSVQLIQQYYAKVEQMIGYGGTRNESTLRKPFQDLLEQYARSKNLVLVPEVEYDNDAAPGARRVRISFRDLFRPGMGARTLQGKETQRPDDCGKIQYLQVRRLQGVRDRVIGENVHSLGQNDGDYQGDAGIV